MEERFFESCRTGDIKDVKELLQNPEINVNWQNEYGETPFWIACEGGNIEVAKLLLNDNRIDINKDIHGKTPFWIACEKRNIEIVKLLVNDERIDINQVSRYGETIFFFSCAGGYFEIVDILLSSRREVNVNIKSLTFGITAIEAARKRAIYRRREAYIYIVGLLESFERNPIETKLQLRILYKLAGK